MLKESDMFVLVKQASENARTVQRALHIEDGEVKEEVERKPR
jgi:hypothetical protein